MEVATVALNCFGGQRRYGPAGPDYAQVYESVDLGAEYEIFAWCDVWYLNGFGAGPWDAGNGYIAEVFSIDGAVLPPSLYGAKLGFLGSPENAHGASYRGRGQYVVFSLKVFQPEEMEVGARGTVLYGL